MYAYLLQWFVSVAEKLSASQAAAESGQLGPNGKKVSRRVELVMMACVAVLASTSGLRQFVSSVS